MQTLAVGPQPPGLEGGAHPSSVQPADAQSPRTFPSLTQVGPEFAQGGGTAEDFARCLVNKHSRLSEAAVQSPIFETQRVND